MATLATKRAVVQTTTLPSCLRLRGEKRFAMTTAVQESSSLGANVVQDEMIPVDEDSTVASAATTSSSSIHSAGQIHARACELFASVADYEHCVSSRLFACAELASRSSIAEAELKPLVPLLTSLVHVEAISLQSTPASNTNHDSVPPFRPEAATTKVAPIVGSRKRKKKPVSDDESSLSSSIRPRRVQFNTCDGSSTLPPVDRQVHLQRPASCVSVAPLSTITTNVINNTSSTLQHQAVEAACRAKEQIQLLSSEVIPSLDRMLGGLCMLFLDQDRKIGDNNANHTIQHRALVSNLAQAIAPDYPIKRVSKLALLYYNDFIKLKMRAQQLPPGLCSPLTQHTHCLSLQTKSYDNPTLPSSLAPLTIEKSLGNLLGQGIRYQLRLLFNQAPPRLTKNNMAYDEMAEKTYSHVADFVALSIDTGTKSIGASRAAVDDACFSALISTALSHLCGYFGLDVLLEGAPTLRTLNKTLPTKFCTSPACQRQLPLRPPRTAENPVTFAHVEEIGAELDVAQSLLLALSAARFLLALWSIPAVVNEIERMGGWSLTETYAATLYRYALHLQVTTADAHLVSLSNHDSLMQALQAVVVMLEPLREAALDGLNTVKAHYRLGGKVASGSNAALRRRYPALLVLDERYAVASEANCFFPKVTAEFIDNDTDEST